MAASERIFKLLDEPLTIPKSLRPRSIHSPKGEIEFRNVWFAYRGGANPKEDDWVSARRFFPRCAGPDCCRSSAIPAPAKLPLIQLLAAVLRNSARPNSAGRNRYSRV